MGKRCNQSARTVIGPDPTLRVDQIAVPNEIADILTYPERVYEHNLDKMQKLVWEDGANYVHRGDKKFVLEYALSGDKRYKFKLQVGDIVDRKLVDGDVVIVNRQPSQPILKARNRWMPSMLLETHIGVNIGIQALI